MEGFEAAESSSVVGKCGGRGDGKGKRGGRMSENFGQGYGFGRRTAGKRGGVDGWEEEIACWKGFFDVVEGEDEVASALIFECRGKRRTKNAESLYVLLHLFFWSERRRGLWQNNLPLNLT